MLPREEFYDGRTASTDEQEFARIIASIESSYEHLGHQLGWRFLNTPRRTLSPRVRIGLITLNPGGTYEPVDHPRASYEGGNAYLTERWPGHEPGAASLQHQVQCLFASLSRHLGRVSPLSHFMSEEVLMGYFVPFRSPRLARLPHRAESIAFAKALWARVLRSWHPRLLLTIDTEAFSAIREIITEVNGYHVQEQRRFDTGWGDYQAEAIRLDAGGDAGAVMLARLPHLSTFKLFSRPACQSHMEQFLGYLTEDLVMEHAMPG